MDNLSSLLGKLSLDKARMDVVAKIVATLPPDVLRDWLASIEMRDGIVVGTSYRGVKSALSAQDFNSLYGALGHDVARPDVWQDFRPISDGCTPWDGATCNSGFFNKTKQK